MANKKQFAPASLVTDDDGDKYSEQRYLPYGEVRGDEDTLPTDFGYTGQRESGFGLMDYHARWYSSYLNRWIQPDTIIPDPANPQSFNRFSYVNNRPLNFVDPSGHVAIPRFDPGTQGDPKNLKYRKEDYGVTEMSSPEELYEAYSSGYNPFFDPNYILENPRPNDTIFAEYYRWALAYDAWLPLPQGDRENWSKYWAAASGHEICLGELLLDPGAMTAVGLGIIAMVRGSGTDASNVDGYRSQQWRPLNQSDLPSSYEPPRGGARRIRVQYGPQTGRTGWLDKRGNIWVPSRPGDSHGGPHWDVQINGGRGGYTNVFPEN